MNKLMTFGVAVLATGTALADLNTCTLKTWTDYSVIDWTNPSNYAEGDPTTGGDVFVKVPDGSKITIDDTTIDGMKDFYAIKPPANGEIVISNTVDKTLSVAFTDMEDSSSDGGSAPRWQITKRGTGAISLTSGGKHTKSIRVLDYWVNFQIEKGAVYLPPTPTIDGNRLMLGNICLVNEDAVIGASDYYMNHVQVRELSGVGIVTNAPGRTDESLLVNAQSLNFSGRIVGVGSIRAVSYVQLTNESSTTTSSVGPRTGGTLAVSSFGLLGNPSPIGTAMPIIDDGGRLLYLGKGEETDKPVKFYVYESPHIEQIVDGGAHGGLAFKKGTAWVQGRKNTYPMVVLQGDGAGTNVYKGSLSFASGTDAANKPKAFAFAKRGAGTWQMDIQGYSGAWYVQDGALAFDALDEAGFKYCPLGTADGLYCFDRARTPVDFAFELGATKSGQLPLLDFNGTNVTWCSTRLVSLVGNGGFRNDSNNEFRFSGVRSNSGGAKNLVLTGTNADGNEIAGIGDSTDHPVSIVKEGTGTWTLNGSNTIHGAIQVKQGTLKVRRDPKRYTWYNFVIQGVNGYDYARFAEIVLCDANGTRLNKNLTWSGIGGSTVKPGTVVLPRRGALGVGHKMGDPQEDPSNLFNGSMTGSDKYRIGYASNFEAWGGSREYVSSSSPLTWIPIMMRLTNVTDVVKYDVVQRVKEDNLVIMCLTQWTLQGSVDGIHWDDLRTDTHDFTGKTSASFANGHIWASSEEPVLPSNTSVPATYTGGYEIPGGPAAAPTFTVLDNVTSISVAAGAKFICEGEAATVKNLEVVAGDAGLVSNVAFAAEGGSIKVTGVDPTAQSVALGTFQNCTGANNLSSWAVSVNGETSERYSLRLKGDGTLELAKKGLVLIVR